MNKQEIEQSISNLERSIQGNKAHNKEHKKEIKELKQQLDELPKLEIGKWYWASKGFSNEALVFVESLDECDKTTFEGYGFNMDGWGFSDGWAVASFNELATDKEVEEALIKEAKKKYIKGDVYNYAINKQITNRIFSGEISYSAQTGNVFDSVNCNLLFNKNNGEWATIVQEKTVPLNGYYTKIQLTDLINNRF